MQSKFFLASVLIFFPKAPTIRHIRLRLFPDRNRRVLAHFLGVYELDMPKSVASSVAAAIGTVSVVVGIGLVTVFPPESRIVGAFIVLLAYFVPVAAYEILVRKVYHRPSTGLCWSHVRERSPERVTSKLVGLATVFAAVVIFHTLFRFYSPMRLVDPIVACRLLAPFVIPLTLIYFVEIDRRMKEPKDGYWHLGAWILGRNKELCRESVKELALGWTVKGLFLPVMFTYLALNVPGLSENLSTAFLNPVSAMSYLITIFVVIELTVVVVGYSMTLRVFDAHIRSTNYYLGAWVVTLICYEPFNRVTGVVLDYTLDRSWSDVILDYPVLLWVWIVLLTASFIGWVWATTIFGLRWSNLTNRGIITNGTYRYTKHPDYFSKCVFFWLTAAPFLTAFSFWQAVTGTAAMVVVNLIYFARAKMEEKHLSEDPDYVAYALAMNQRSIFVPLNRFIPALKYKRPPAHATEHPVLHDPVPVVFPAE